MGNSTQAKELLSKQGNIESKQAWQCMNCKHARPEFLGVKRNRYLSWEKKVAMVVNYRDRCSRLDEFHKPKPSLWNNGRQDDPKWVSEKELDGRLPNEHRCKNFTYCGDGQKKKAKRPDSWERLITQALVCEEPDPMWHQLICVTPIPEFTFKLLSRSRYEGLWYQKLSNPIAKGDPRFGRMITHIMVYLKGLVDSSPQKEALLLMLSASPKGSIGASLWWYYLNPFNDDLATQVQKQYELTPRPENVELFPEIAVSEPIEALFSQDQKDVVSKVLVTEIRPIWGVYTRSGLKSRVISTEKLSKVGGYALVADGLTFENARKLV